MGGIRAVLHRCTGGGTAGLAAARRSGTDAGHGTSMGSTRLAGAGGFGAGLLLLEPGCHTGGRRHSGHHEQRPDSGRPAGQPVDMEPAGRPAETRSRRRRDRPVTLAESALGSVAGPHQKISINRPIMTIRTTRKIKPEVMAGYASIP